MALQYESNMQNLVYQLDQGSGRKVIQSVLFVLFAFAMAALYTFTNFQGLKNARAMEEAQLARQLAVQGRLTTQVVRPLSIGRLADRVPDDKGRIHRHPDLLHPPGWPLLLAGLYRVTGIPQTGVPTAAHVHGHDYIPVGFSHFFAVLSALWVWLMARKLFDPRVAALSVGAYLVSDLIWRNSLQGADWSAAMFFMLGAVYAALWAVDRPANTPLDQVDGPLWRRLAPLIVAALLTAMAFLTRYAAGMVALAVFLYVGTSRHRRAWGLALLYLAVAVLAVTPWMLRNISISGNPFGLVFLNALSGTYLFPGDSLFRMLRPELPDLGAGMHAVQVKIMANLRSFSESGFGLGGGGILLALFGAMYFHRFNRPSSRRLRWCLLPAVVLLALVIAAYGEDALPAMVLFWPLAIPYAWAFCLVLLDRLQFEARFFAIGAMTVVMFLSGLPLLFQVLPPRTGLPYPPYFHRYVGWFSTMLENDECIVTDIPWATAWYGGKTSILLPRTIDGFYDIHQNTHPIAMAYFTTVTRNKPWIRELSDPTSPEHSWYQIFAGGRVPSGFPLTHARYLAGTDQLLLADRVRW